MAGLFSPEFIERVRGASDIVDVVGSCLPLKRAGANFVALCPFHREKTPSFSVSASKQMFYCFGCHKGGSVFTFLQEYESIDFPEAVKRLADRAKIPLEFQGGGTVDHQARHVKDTLLQIHEQITLRWQAALTNSESGQIARDYLARRGVSDEAIKLFRLGYAPDAWDDTVNWAKSKGYDLPSAEKAGLILRKEETDRYYDRFRGRLMFPICDEQGRVVAFSGRVLSGDEKTAKYVNSPETPIFTKSRIFFGLDKSKRALLEAGFAIICEGQLDLIACYMAGVQNVVAPQGTAFTGDHARILQRYVPEVVLCFDSDNAGQNAAVRALDHLLASKLAIRVAVVPAPHDPDSFIKENGGLAFQALISQAPGFFDYYLQRLCSIHDTGTDKGRLAVLSAMGEAVHKTGNVVLVDKYAQKTALRLAVAPESVRAEFKKMSRSQPQAPETSGDQEEVTAVAPPGPAEQWLLKLLLMNEDMAGWASAHLDPNWVRHPAAREIVSKRIVAHTNATWTSVPAFLEEFQDAQARELVSQAAADDRPLPNPAQVIVDVTLRLRNEFIELQRADLLRQASQPGISEAAQLELLQQRHVLLAAKNKPLSVPQSTT